jgi:hypothetical protein
MTREERRLELHETLCNILGSRNVYFQPPESVKMKYPAIRYSLNDIDNYHADNKVYLQDYSYSLVFITRDPDDDVVNKLSQLPKCRYDRFFISDNLNHYFYVIYY